MASARLKSKLLFCGAALATLASACSEPLEQAELAERLPPPPESQRLDLNAVTLDQLLAARSRIDGLTSDVARNIVEFREQFAYRRVQDLLAVPRIGEKTYIKLRRFFYVRGAEQ